MPTTIPIDKGVKFRCYLICLLAFLLSVSPVNISRVGLFLLLLFAPLMAAYRLHVPRGAAIPNLRHIFSTVSLEHGVDIKTLSAIIGHVSNSTTLNVCAYGEEECEKLLAEMKLIAQGIPAEEIAGFAEADGNTAVTGPRRPGLSKAMMDASRPGNTAHVDHANVLYQIPASIR